MGSCHRYKKKHSDTHSLTQVQNILVFPSLLPRRSIWWLLFHQSLWSRSAHCHLAMLDRTASNLLTARLIPIRNTGGPKARQWYVCSCLGNWGRITSGVCPSNYLHILINVLLMLSHTKCLPLSEWGAKVRCSYTLSSLGEHFKHACLFSLSLELCFLCDRNIKVYRMCGFLWGSWSSYADRSLRVRSCLSSTCRSKMSFP